MKTKNLLWKIHEAGITLQVENGALRILGRKEALTPALLYEIKAQKSELIEELLNPEQEPYDPPLPSEALQKLASIVKILMKMDQEAREIKVPQKP